MTTVPTATRAVSYKRNAWIHKPGLQLIVCESQRGWSRQRLDGWVHMAACSAVASLLGAAMNVALGMAFMK